SGARAQVGVALLDDAIARPAIRAGDRVRLGNPPAFQIAGSDSSDFARANQSVEGAHGFPERRVRIVPVGGIKGQPVGSEPPQALVALALDLGRTEATRAAGVVEAQFGRNHHLVASAALLHPEADRGLALAALAARQPRGVKFPVSRNVPPFSR